jgi:hypothetical protein
MKTYYHVTPKENLSSIMQNGLIPHVGERTKELNESKAVFLFPTEEDMEDALQNWLGDCFDEDIELVCLKIVLPDDFPIQDSCVDWEKISKVTIPPQYIFLQEAL